MTYNGDDADDAPAVAAELPTARGVRSFLQQNPDFLVENPDLIEVIVAPKRDNGKGVVDMQSFMVERLQK